MLFLSVDRLVTVSGGKSDFRDLRGAGSRAPLAGAAFAVGAMSIVGIPMLGGFSSKMFPGTGGVGADRMESAC